MMTRVFLAVAMFATLGSSFVARTARAQGWLADRSTAQGRGFSAGNLVIHPGIGLEAGYDTNLFRESENVNGAAILRLTGHVFLETRKPQDTEGGVADGAASNSGSGGRAVYFRLGAAASYQNFFDDDAEDNVAATGDMLFTINPDGRYQLTLANVFTRTIRPFVDSATEANFVTYGRNSNVARIEGLLGSPGRTFQAVLGYEFGLDFFDSAAFDYVNSFNHRPYLNFTYRFLPRTAVFASTELVYRQYPNDSDAPTLLSDGAFVRARAGLNGALTPKLSFTLAAGYTAGFFDQLLDDFDSANARVELRYAPRRSINLALGYDRDFRPSFVGNFVRADAIYANAKFVAFGSFLLGARVRVSFEETGIALSADGGALGTQARREDIRVLAGLYSEYRFTSWLALTLEANVRTDTTDFEFTAPPDGTLFPDPAGGFVAFDVFGGVRAFF